MLQLKRFKNDEKYFYFTLKDLFVLRMFKFLSPLTVNEFTVHDSFSFAEEVANFDSYRLLDVECLFTNIPLYEAIENCINNLFSINYIVHNFIKEDLKELLKFVSYESFSTFDTEYYCQLDCVILKKVVAF